MAIDLERTVAGIADAHRQQDRVLDGIDNDIARRPSRLPGWSVGHVLTHLARNADSLTRGLEGARRGEAWARYPGGDSQRASDIEVGADRPAGQLRRDLRDASRRLEEALQVAADRGWAGNYRGPDGPLPITQLPFKRWREVLCHLVDLDVGFEYTDWPDEYALAEVANYTEAVGALPGALASRPVLDQAAWVMSRLDVTGADGPGQWY